MKTAPGVAFMATILGCLYLDHVGFAVFFSVIFCLF